MRGTGLERQPTPVKVKVKRLEAIGRDGTSPAGRMKAYQTKIFSFVKREGGGEKTEKVLDPKETRQTHSLLDDRCPLRASPEAQRLAKTKSGTSKATATLS